MFNHKLKKSAIFIVTAVLMLAAVIFTACNTSAFEPVEKPAAATPVGNGGNAVRYGDWIYYVNGYQSSATAENTYEKINARVGAIARIKIEDIESLFAVHENTQEFTTSTARTNEIARIVAEKAEIVVPKFYYSGNTTSTNINGIYIFNDRLYMLTPNDALTAGGASLTSQSVLTSFGLDGSDEQRHYVFTNNAAQVLLGVRESDSKLLATYIMGSEVGTVDVIAGTSLAKIEDVTSPQIDVADQSVFYINSDKAICNLKAGDSEGKVVVANEKDGTVTYTISSVNNGYVYYTKADTANSGLDGLHVYYKTVGSSDEAVALRATAPSSNWYGYKDQGIVKAYSDKSDPNYTLYGISIYASDAKTLVKNVVAPINNSSSITFNRIEGSVLYYTSDSVAYMVDLDSDVGPVAIGRSLASASGWSVPDVLAIEGENYNYVITLSSGSVSAVKYYTEANTNSSSVTLTIVEPAEEE